MLKICATLASLIVVTYAAGEFTILHSPDAIYFKGNDNLDQSLLKEVFSAALGFTTSKGSSWPGVTVANPFNYPEAIVVVEIDGTQKFGRDDKAFPSFGVNSDEDISVTWQTLSSRILKRYPSQNNTLMHIQLADGSDAIEPYYNMLGDLETNIKSIAPLDASIRDDYLFATEIALLNEIARKVESGAVSQDGIPDIFWFTVSGLQGVADQHGADSVQMEKAKSMLQEALNNVNRAFRAAYNEQVLVASLTIDGANVRRTRAAPSDSKVEGSDINLSPKYSADYAVIFNIILWFSVAFTFAIIATALAIGTMDPGRDSIIYRMTSNRMKKDN